MRPRHVNAYPFAMPEKNTQPSEETITETHYHPQRKSRTLLVFFLLRCLFLLRLLILSLSLTLLLLLVFLLFPLLVLLLLAFLLLLLPLLILLLLPLFLLLLFRFLRAVNLLLFILLRLLRSLNPNQLLGIPPMSISSLAFYPKKKKKGWQKTTTHPSNSVTTNAFSLYSCLRILSYAYGTMAATPSNIVSRMGYRSVV